MKNIVDQQDFAEDGVFWMDFNDFMEEFTEIYVCRHYTENKGWKDCMVEDEWKGKYNQGLPTA